jgi:hypothetical protein
MPSEREGRNLREAVEALAEQLVPFSEAATRLATHLGSIEQLVRAGETGAALLVIEQARASLGLLSRARQELGGTDEPRAVVVCYLPHNRRDDREDVVTQAELEERLGRRLEDLPHAGLSDGRPVPRAVTAPAVAALPDDAPPAGVPEPEAEPSAEPAEPAPLPYDVVPYLLRPAPVPAPSGPPVPAARGAVPPPPGWNRS